MTILISGRSIIGAGLGGTLAEPVKNYPTFFRSGGLFDQFPYLLPNLVCAAVVILGLIVGLLFLEETHEDKRDRRDIGLETGQWILRTLAGSKGKVESSKVGYIEETLTFIAEDEKADYHAIACSPHIPVNASSAPDPASQQYGITNEPVNTRLSWRQGLTKQVKL